MDKSTHDDKYPIPLGEAGLCGTDTAGGSAPTPQRFPIHD